MTVLASIHTVITAGQRLVYAGRDNNCSYSERPGWLAMLACPTYNKGTASETLLASGRAKVAAPKCSQKHVGLLRILLALSVFSSAAAGQQQQNCGELLPNNPVMGNWDRDRVRDKPNFKTSNCLMRNLSHKSVIECLSGKDVVFLGDSVLRYQYLALAFFIAHGYTQHPYGQGQEKSLTKWMGWGDWQKFYGAVPGVLTRNSTYGRSEALCNCKRLVQSVSSGDYEYWEFKFTPNAPGLKPFVLRCHTVFAYPSFKEAGLIGMNWAFKDKKPDVVILNMGLWYGAIAQKNNRSVDPHAHAFLEALEPVFELGRDLRNRTGSNTLLLWRSNTAFVAFNPTVHSVAQMYGWKVMDISLMVANAQKQGIRSTWDAFHFHNFMYEAINTYFLNVLCTGSSEH